MAYEQREGSGALFKNDKDGTESRPDYKGDIRIGGKEYWLSSWIKEGKNGKFMSIQATAKDQKAAPVKQGVQTSPPADFDDPIPF